MPHELDEYTPCVDESHPHCDECGTCSQAQEKPIAMREVRRRVSGKATMYHPPTWLCMFCLEATRGSWKS